MGEIRGRDVGEGRGEGGLTWSFHGGYNPSCSCRPNFISLFVGRAV